MDISSLSIVLARRQISARIWLALFMERMHIMYNFHRGRFSDVTTIPPVEYLQIEHLSLEQRVL